jgi:hypothetical protein
MPNGRNFEGHGWTFLLVHNFGALKTVFPALSDRTSRTIGTTRLEWKIALRWIQKAGISGA